MEMCLKGRDKEACVDMHPNVLPLSVGLALIRRSCDSSFQLGWGQEGSDPSVKRCPWLLAPTARRPVWREPRPPLSHLVVLFNCRFISLSIFVWCQCFPFLSAQPLPSGCRSSSSNFQKKEKPSMFRKTSAGFCNVELLTHVFILPTSQRLVNTFYAKRLQERNIEHVVNH